MISAMTIAELGARMRCRKCGGKDVLSKVATGRADALGDSKLSDVLQDFLHLRCCVRAQRLPANVAQF